MNLYRGHFDRKEETAKVMVMSQVPLGQKEYDSENEAEMETLRVSSAWHGDTETSFQE